MHFWLTFFFLSGPSSHLAHRAPMSPELSRHGPLPTAWPSKRLSCCFLWTWITLVGLRLVSSQSNICGWKSTLASLTLSSTEPCLGSWLKSGWLCMKHQAFLRFGCHLRLGTGWGGGRDLNHEGDKGQHAVWQDLHLHQISDVIWSLWGPKVQWGEEILRAQSVKCIILTRDWLILDDLLTDDKNVEAKKRSWACSTSLYLQPQSNFPVSHCQS